MEELLWRIRPDDLIAILAITLTFLAGMVVWLTLQWRLHRRTQTEASLKQDMLNRGMSAEEIERVMKAHLG